MPVSDHVSLTHLPTLVRHALHDPGSLFDLCRASLLVSFGFWLLHPGWAHARFPNVSLDMEILAPVPVWGLVCTLIGIALGIATVLRHRPILTLCYFLSFGIWVCISLLFVQRSVPVPEGYMAIVIALYTLFRIVWVGNDGESKNVNSSKVARGGGSGDAQ